MGRQGEVYELPKPIMKTNNNESTNAQSNPWIKYFSPKTLLMFLSIYNYCVVSNLCIMLFVIIISV